MNKKRQLLIDTALALFYKNGINCIGINEILKVSGVAKKTLYSHFESKEALILAALAQRHSIFIAWLNKALRGSDSDKEVITALFSALERWFTNSEPLLGNFRGCFFINSSAEFSDKSSDIARCCKNHKQEVRKMIAHYLTKENTPLLDVICIMMEGAITTAHITGEHQVTTKCIDALNNFDC
ncbi:MAG: TetR/AcrR family transcriptional regulator [Psychrobium sp.]|nr:TetR/AcrR family transcriptional regulator [Psychrobium sp.]